MEVSSFFARLFFSLFACLLFVLLPKALRLFSTKKPDPKIENQKKKAPTKPTVATSVRLSTLPEDLLASEILPRLPAKSLVRFKSVSKPWRSLITSDRFVSDHLARSRQSGAKRFVVVKHRCWYPAANAVALFSSETNSVSAAVTMPFEARYFFKSMKLVGSVDGLLCLSDHECCSDPGMFVIIWNPSLAGATKLRLLPKSLFSEARARERVTRVVHGFGYDPAADDYKVLKVVHVHDSKRGGGAAPRFLAEVYSLRADAWSEVARPCGVGHRIYEASCAALHGALHWIVFGLGSPVDDNRIFVLRFDLATEEFSRVDLPDLDYYQSGLGTRLTELSGRLCLLAYTQEGWDKWLEVWTLEEGGRVWRRRFTVGPFLGSARLLGCGWNGEVYMEDRNARLVLYNPKTDEIRKMGPTILTQSYNSDSEAHLYVESLVWRD